MRNFTGTSSTDMQRRLRRYRLQGNPTWVSTYFQLLHRYQTMKLQSPQSMIFRSNLSFYLGENSLSVGQEWAFDMNAVQTTVATASFTLVATVMNDGSHDGLCTQLLNSIEENGRLVPALVHLYVGSIVHHWGDCRCKELSCRARWQSFGSSES